MISTQPLKRGRFSYEDESGQTQHVAIDFNPTSLDYTISLNTQGEGGEAQQIAGTASAKLNLELIFDSTDTGDDVRSRTGPVERLLRPIESTTPNAPPAVAPRVTFEWGAFSFVGVVDSFKQTMDFFSAEGVPLRAVVALSMLQSKYEFDQTGRGDSAAGDPTLVLPGGNPAGLAAAAGDPFAARAIASLNGLESLRAGVSGGITVGGGVTLGAAAGFSAGASAGVGGGVGAGVSAGFEIGFGGSASAGVSASAGAFAGLHAPSATASAGANAARRLFHATSTPGLSASAQFDVTGRVVAQGQSAFQTAQGAARLRFDSA